MSDILPSLVHELRTPLTALKGALGLLSVLAEDASPDIANFATMAMRNTLKLSGMLDDVAAFVRVKDPDLAVTREPVDPWLLLEMATERVAPLATERGVVLSVEGMPVRPHPDDEAGMEKAAAAALPDVMIHEALVRDAVARMMFYAVRVTPRGGRVTVSVEVEPDHVVIRIADQGKLVSEESRALVLEPFSAVARRGVDTFDHAGLDLAIAKIVAERHDGTLEYCQPGNSGVVRMTLGTGS